MAKNKDKKKRGDVIPIGLLKEFARPRITKSARLAEEKFNESRRAGLPSITLAGRVDRIIPGSIRNGTEMAQISLQYCQREYRDLRIENTLIDSHGAGVKLKSGARVEVTLTSNPKLKPPE